MPKSFQKEDLMSAKSGTCTSVLHILATCNITKKVVNIIYTKAHNSGVDRGIHNQVFFPMGQMFYPENMAEVISLLWTHTSITSLRGWKPNHFVLCFPDITKKVII